MLSIFGVKSNYMVGVCGLVVGKLVTRLGVRNYLATQYTGDWLVVSNICSLVRTRWGFCKQAPVAFTQAVEGCFTDMVVGFYTLPTGPTNTTKLNKGINL